MAHPPEESLLANVPAELRARPEARRAAELVVALQGDAAKRDPFETFAALDALPAEVVKAVLASWTGAPPDPEALDEATRRAHGFPPAPMHLRLQRAMKPANADAVRAMGPMAAEQLRAAGAAWDGQDVPVRARLAEGAGDREFAKTVELRWFVDAESGARVADVVTVAGDSGTVFLADTTIVAGAIAYGVVEARDARLRTALQAAMALPATVEQVEAPPEPEVVEREPMSEVTEAAVAWAEEPSAIAMPDAELASRRGAAERGGPAGRGRPAAAAAPVRKELVEKIDALTAEVEELAARISSSTDVAAAAGDEVDSAAPTVKRVGAKKKAGAKAKAAAGAKKKAAAAPKKKAAAGAKKKAAAAPKKKAAAAPKKKAAAGAKKAAAAPKKAAAAPKKKAAGGAKKAAAAPKKKAAAGAKKAAAPETAAGAKKKAAAPKKAAGAKKKAAAKR